MRIKIFLLLMVQLHLGVSNSCINKNPRLSIEAPSTMEALNGSCLQIPCSFKELEREQGLHAGDTIGFWFRDRPEFLDHPHVVIYNGSRPSGSQKVQILGNLTVRNCTTLISQPNHTNYYFRVKSKAFQATASCKPVLVKVKDSPWIPELVIPANLSENQSVIVTCSAPTPCPRFPPKLSWDLRENSQSYTEINASGEFTTIIQENITLSDSDDGLTVHCSARYPVDDGKRFKTSETRQTLNVLYAPKNTLASASPSGLVSAGSWVNLTCSCRANPPANFSWFQISRKGEFKVADGALHSFVVTTVTERFDCVASNALGQQTSTWRLEKTTVSSNLPVVTIVAAHIAVIVLVIIILFVCVRCFKNRKRNTNIHRTEPAVEHYAQVQAERAAHVSEYVLMHSFQNRPSAVSAVGKRSGLETTVTPKQRFALNFPHQVLQVGTGDAHDLRTAANGTEKELHYEYEDMTFCKKELGAVQNSRWQ